MPNFRLREKEAQELAHFLIRSSKDKASPALKLPVGDAKRGASLVATNHCASCHQGLPQATSKTPPISSILKLDWSAHGCASNDKGKKKENHAPKLNLLPSDSANLEQFRQHLTDHPRSGLSATSSHDYAARELKAMNCAACHENDATLSKLDTFHALSAHLTKGVPQDDHHKIDQSRPSLTYAGEMLHSDYLQRIIAGTVDKRPRPWLAMRMPSFPSRAPLLAKGLAAQHGMPNSTGKNPQIDPKKRDLGKKIIGSNGGFACTICHANADAQSHCRF